MADNANQTLRKPVGNFFIKKSLQMGLIIKILAAALVSSAISSGALLLVYYLKYNTIAVYIWNQDNNNLQKDHIIYLILPTLIISMVVGLLVAFGIGLYASRKFAVPVYKIEQWAGMILGGKMTAVLKFREEEEMKDLSQKCNELGSFVRETMIEIQKDVQAIQAAGVTNPKLSEIAEKLNKLELTNNPIEIHSP
ncbi:MAG: hypothetical protein LBH93_04365 [Chitinispirillales bacterium]|jgi:methyl-accepting chemotaxis protein|nr:hypothetical protein [Chitinispirillales bacterium]